VDTGPVSASAIDVLLAAARTGLDRVRPEDLAGEMAAGALVVDIRPVEQRSRDGGLDGALVIDRNVLEWRVDPTCPHHIPQATDASQRIVVVCNEGYSSSLAADTLRRIGIPRATDLVGASRRGAPTPIARSERRAEPVSFGYTPNQTSGR
jgi:rhodanese-related sulfurtransferase